MNTQKALENYRIVKQKFPDAVQIARMNLMYELYNEDARVAADLLGLPLQHITDVEGLTEKVEFPRHNMDKYLHKFIRAGYRVAICDEDALIQA